MVDPLGVTGASLAIATLLYNTCRTIQDIIGDYKKAPKEYRDLSQDLEALQSALSSLRVSLNDADDSSLSQEALESLKDLDLPLRSCNNACEDFQKKLLKMTTHSTEDHTSIRDRLLLHFKKSDITLLREKLNASKGTIQVALGSQEKLNAFQETTATTMSEFSGMIQALSLAVDTLSTPDTSITQQNAQMVTQKLNEHEQLLKQCLLFCTSAMSATHASIEGTQVKHAKALGRARQVIGNLGSIKPDAPPVKVDTAEASEQAFQGIGNIDLSSVSKDGLDFLAGK